MEISTYYRLLKNVILTALSVYCPRTAEVAVNYACNLDCLHCSRKTLDQGELPLDVLTRFFMEFDRRNGVYVTFTGGEPLLRKDLPEMLHFIKRYTRLKSSVTTNAVLLTPDMLSRLKEGGLHGLNISLYGPEERHDYFVNRKGAFKITLENAIHAIGVIPSVCFMTVPTKESLRDGSFSFVIEMGKRHGVPVRINLPTYSGNFARKEHLLNDEERKTVHSLLRSGSIETDSVGLYTHNRCPSTHSAFYIAPTGEFTPCPFLHFSFGNIREMSLSQLYAEVVGSGYHRIKFGKYICPPAEDHQLIDTLLKPLYDGGNLPVRQCNAPLLGSFIRSRLR